MITIQIKEIVDTYRESQVLTSPTPDARYCVFVIFAEDDHVTERVFSHAVQSLIHTYSTDKQRFQPWIHSSERLSLTLYRTSHLQRLFWNYKNKSSASSSSIIFLTSCFPCVHHCTSLTVSTIHTQNSFTSLPYSKYGFEANVLRPDVIPDANRTYSIFTINSAQNWAIQFREDGLCRLWPASNCRRLSSQWLRQCALKLADRRGIRIVEDGWQLNWHHVVK